MSQYTVMRKLMVDVVSLLLILLFVYTGMSKLLDFRTFNFQMHFYPWIHYIGNFLSWGLPIVEFAIAGMLIIPVTKLYGLYASLILLSIFTIYLILMISFKYNLPCSCGGVIKYMTWRQHIAFNTGFILITTIGIYNFKRETKIIHTQPMVA